MRNCTRLAVLLLFSIASVAWAQKPPAIELGFKADRAYDVSNVDSVNLFNGNVIINIPLGLTYPVSGSLNYGLVLSYNSKAWDYRFGGEGETTGPWTWSVPNLRSNAGMGWRVSLGELSDGFYYGPSGDEHDIGTSTTPAVTWSKEAPYLRAVKGVDPNGGIDPNVMDIELPDGRSQRFELERGAWRLKWIRDRSLNYVWIAYEYVIPGSTTDHRVRRWIITDSTSQRTHYVNFADTGYSPDMAQGNSLGMNITSIEFQGVETETGSPRTYTITFDYGDLVEVPFSCLHRYFYYQPGYPTSPPDVRLLKNLILPDQTQYSFQYNLTESTNCEQGLVRDMTLPTMGEVEYTYQIWHQSPDDLCSLLAHPTNYSPGIAKRKADGKEWKYLQSRGPGAPGEPPFVVCNDQQNYMQGSRWARTSVLSPPDATANPSPRTRSDHYFSVYATQTTKLDPGFGAHQPLFRYGEPSVAAYPGNAAAGDAPEFNESSPDVVATDDGQSNSAGNRSLSEQLWSDCDATGDCNTLVRSVYRRFTSIGTAPEDQRELISDRTVFNDDACSTCYLQTDRTPLSYDTVGNFRDVKRYSNFPATGDAPGEHTLIESIYTNFDSWSTAKKQSRITLWNTSLYTDQTRTASGGTAKTTFCFDFLGRLTRNGVLSGTTAGGVANDIVVEYEYDVNNGANVIRESSYGGDGSGLNADNTITSLCNISLGTAKYRNRFEWSNGILANSRYVDPATGADLSFKTTDFTVSPGTGLVVVSRAADELDTKYAYEPWGRLTKVTPPGEAPTSYQVNAATESTFSNIVVTRDPGPTSNDEVINKFEYDRMGRLQRSERTLPGPGCVEQVLTYDDPGRKLQDSVWKPCGTAADANSYRYDGAGRLTAVVAPDSTEIVFAYKGTREKTRTMSIATGTAGQTSLATTTERYDALGRLIEVSERSGPSDIVDGTHASKVKTTYQYDVGDRLTHVLMTGVESGSPTQPRTFGFDNRGFLLSESHPETGTITYENYDARGHAQYKKATPTHSLWNLKFQYDAAERITHVYSGSPGWIPEYGPSSQYHIHKKFVFGTANDPSTTPVNRTKAKMIEATRENYAAWSEQSQGGVGLWYGVVETYGYKSLSGRPSNRNTTIIEREHGEIVKSIDQDFSYDSLGLTDKIHYPLCEYCGIPNVPNPQREIQPTYQRGVLTALPGYVNSVTYAPHGGLKSQVHSNGITDTVAEDTHKMARPRSFTFGAWSECGTQPAFSLEPTNVTIPSGQSTTLHSSASGVTYQWYEGWAHPGQLIPGATQASYTTPLLSTTKSYYVRITNACRSINSRIATVTVTSCQAPSIGTNPAATTPMELGQTVTLNVVATGTAPLAYQWYRATSGVTSNPVGDSSNSYTTTQLPVGTTTFWVRVSNGCGTVDSTTANVVVLQPFGAPTGVTATRINSSTIEVGWQPVSGATQYKIRRRSAGSPFSQVAVVSSGTSWPDTNVTAGLTYVYTVHAANASGGQESADSNYELATMMTFTTVATNVTTFDASHFQQLLDGLNAVRGVSGNGPLSWSNLPQGILAPASQGPIRRAHVEWLRLRMNEALQALQLPTPAFSNPDLQQQPEIRAVHIQQLQQRAQ